MRLLPQTFRCQKLPISNPEISKPSSSSTKDPSAATLIVKSEPKPKKWCVYLIISSNSPIKTYVGVTLDFDRRGGGGKRSFTKCESASGKAILSSGEFLCVEDYTSKRWRNFVIFIRYTSYSSHCQLVLSLKQHNGEIKGGAKATRAGRPWICACMINGFKDQSQACEFESKWKEVSRKVSNKRKEDDMGKQVDDQTLRLLKNRQRALEKVKCLFDCSQFEFDWQLDPF